MCSLQSNETLDSPMRPLTPLQTQFHSMSPGSLGQLLWRCHAPPAGPDPVLVDIASTFQMNGPGFNSCTKRCRRYTKQLCCLSKALAPQGWGSPCHRYTAAHAHVRICASAHVRVACARSVGVTAGAPKMGQESSCLENPKPMKPDLGGARRIVAPCAPWFSF